MSWTGAFADFVTARSRSFEATLTAIFLGAAFFSADVFAVAAFFTAAFLGAIVFDALDSAAPAFFIAHRFFRALTIAALPAALNFRLGFENSGLAFDVSLECFTGGFFSVPEDASKLTASFARVTATLAF